MVNPSFLYKGLPPPGLLAVAYIASGIVLPVLGIYWGLVFLWPGLLYAAVSYAYLRNGTWGARLIGKRAHGTGAIPAIRLLVFLPYLVTAWLVWWLRHAIFLSHEDGYNVVAPGIYLGRFPLWFPRRPGRLGPFPKEQVAVVDLCAEFPALPHIVAQAGGRYFCLPCLDGDMPEDKSVLLQVAREVAGWGSSVPVYVHCANGRGRSCCFVALVMMLREGGPRTVDEAVALIKQRRPQVNVHRAQKALVTDVMRMHEEGDIKLTTTRVAAAE